MPKKLDTSSRAKQEGKMISVRIEPQIRYLAEVAAAAKKMSLTDYLEWALSESFKLVTLHVPSELDPVFDQDSQQYSLPDEVDSDEARTEVAAKLVSNVGHLLWSESEYMRMLMRSIIAPQTMPESDVALLAFVEAKKEWRIHVGDNLYKMDRTKIDAEWDSIKAAFARAKAGKGK